MGTDPEVSGQFLKAYLLSESGQSADCQFIIEWKPNIYFGYIMPHICKNELALLESPNFQHAILVEFKKRNQK